MIMNQIFTMENRLFHHLHPLKNGCLEFQVGEIEAPHQTILNFWNEFLDSVFVAGDTFAVMFASPSVRTVRSRVFPSQNKNRHHGFGLLIKKILHLRCVFFFE